jgi:FtsP/CotA-like multicopper oxidase with cupredoxin domain
VLGGGAAVVRVVLDSGPKSNVGDLSFKTPLAIPPLLDDIVDDRGRSVFDLTLQTGSKRIVPSGEATTWGVNGPLLGPTLRARRGEVVAPVVHNELPEDTTIHWHGMHLPAVMDGGPHQMIGTGESWHPEWTIENPASTLWYHPHPHGRTAEHVYRGVAGLFLIEDDESDALGLPHGYGVDDVPLIVQDRLFDDSGELEFRNTGGLGLFGDTILVNGTYDPSFAVTRTLTRFRILNGSNTRFYNLGFTDDRPFRLIATDNGFVPGEPVELTRLLVGPGERAEIVVAFAAGDDVILRSHEQDLHGVDVIDRLIGANDTFDLIRFRAIPGLSGSPSLPIQLAVGNGPPVVPDDARRRTFRLDGHTAINGKEMDMTRIDEVVPAGALEVWEVESNSQPHTFHIHGATFHVLEVEGEKPPAHLRGPKDTVFVSSGHSVRLAVQFGQHTDPDMPYMFHCHLLRHEDNGMMGQFVVVEPGTEDSAPRTIDDHAHH